MGCWRWASVAVLTVACGGAAPSARLAGAPLAVGVRAVDAHTARASRHLVSGWPAYADNGDVHAVIEIPAGTNAKVEVDHDSGELRWEHREGRPRVIDFLGYPGSYGFIPSTVLPQASGGDGDPLDVLVLGASVDRGAVIAVRPVAVLRLLDEGEQDDKILAIEVGPPDAPFGDVADLEDLEARYPAALEIIGLWFTHYDAAQSLEVQGWANAATARDTIAAAAEAFREHGR